MVRRGRRKTKLLSRMPQIKEDEKKNKQKNTHELKVPTKYWGVENPVSAATL